MLRAFILTILTLGVSSQPAELICFNPPTIPDDAVASRQDLSQLQPLLERGIELTEPQLEGLSIEEAAATLPQILNNTAITLFQEALDTEEDFNPADITLVTLQSLLNTTNGVEIFNTMVQEPDSVVRAFLIVIQNFDLECMDKPNIVMLTLLTTLMSDVLRDPFRDSFVDVVITTTVTIAQLSNETDGFVDILESLTENLDQAENVGGALGSLLSFVTEDAITAALSSALGDAGFILEPEAIGAVLTTFFGRIQESFGIDGQEFVSFMNDIFKGILSALT